jgi:hypothetical protein
LRHALYTGEIVEVWDGSGIHGHGELELLSCWRDETSLAVAGRVVDILP